VALWERMAAVPTGYLFPDGSVHDIEPGAQGGTLDSVVVNVVTTPFTNTTFSGSLRAIAIEIAKNVTQVSFTSVAFGQQLTSTAFRCCFSLLLLGFLALLLLLTFTDLWTFSVAS